MWFIVIKSKKRALGGKCMRRLEFFKHGLYIAFGVTDSQRIVLCGISDSPSAELIGENPSLTPLELHTTGTNQDSHHGAKHTGGDILFYRGHTDTRDSICLELENDRLSCKLIYEFFEGASTLRCHAELTNISSEDVGLEYVSSMCIYGLHPERIYIPHNSWCRELDVRAYTPEELGFSKINHSSMKRIAVSSTGTWSTKEYLPMGAVREKNRTFLWQIEHNGSWAYEISDDANEIYLKLSGPSEQESGWWKKLLPGETFTTVKASLTVTSGDISDAVANMTKYRRHIAYRSSADISLPVIFNDYMHCLNADPTTEKLLPVIDAAAAAGAEIFCMDAGWYADGTWWETVGEWRECEKRFPNGMKEIFDRIREKGMMGGIWLEPESIGIKCPILNRFDDSCFFMRHGKRVIDHGRYQLDFRSKKVTDFLDGVVDRLVCEYGVGYFKFDYNIDGGVGTEIDADSFGEGLVGHNEAYIAWLDGIYKRHPELIIEACASGGMRMDYKTLSHTSLCSLTDAWKYEHITPIAQSSQVAVIPEQSAVWCVPEREHDLGEISICMVNAMLKRMHLSGKTPWLEGEHLELIKEGVEFYKSTREHIARMTAFYPCGFATFQDTISVVGYKNDEKAYLLVTNLGDETDIDIPLDGYGTAFAVYPKRNEARSCTSANGIVVHMAKRSAVVLEVK